METARDIASIKLGNNIHKIVKVALMNYRSQSAFYRKCNSPNAHVSRMTAHFYQGFLMETKSELATNKVKTATSVFGLKFKSRKAILKVA